MMSWFGVPQRYASNFHEHGYDTTGFLPGMTEKVSAFLKSNKKNNNSETSYANRNVQE